MLDSLALPVHGGRVAYRSGLGQQMIGDSREVLQRFDDESIDLIVTSPPFALLREKSYGNEEQSAYVDWLGEFGTAALPKLREKGSFVLDLGGAYQRGRPVRSLYNYRVLLRFVDDLGYSLAEEFFWYNPAKLPSPIEWVNKRKIRVKDAVNTVWWLSKSAFPKADVTRVLKPYSKRMEKLLEDPEKFYTAKQRPSGHDVSTGFGSRRKGAIPPNLLEIPNTASTTPYLMTLKQLERERHPARFPEDLPKFFIEFLTDLGDLVVDIFSGSNTTGQVAETLGRKWVSIEEREDFAALSAVRFTEGWDLSEVREIVSKIESGEAVDLRPLQQALFS